MSGYKGEVNSFFEVFLNDFGNPKTLLRVISGFFFPLTCDLAGSAQPNAIL